MNTPITDAAAQTITIDCDDSCVSIYVYESDKIYEGGLVAAHIARRLELDRSALMEALALCRRTLGELHASFSTPEEWQALWPAIKAAKSALSAARANFPES